MQERSSASGRPREGAPVQARRPRGRLLRGSAPAVASEHPAAAEEPVSGDSGSRRERPSAPDLDAVLELARLLAERIVGHALAVSDEALRHWARTVIDEARGARHIHLIGSPEDVDRLRGMARELAGEDRQVRVSADPELARGALRVETELGTLAASVDGALAVLVGMLGAGSPRGRTQSR